MNLETHVFPFLSNYIFFCPLRLWARISENLGAIEVTELNWIKSII